MVLVEPDPVISQMIEFFPGLEVLGISPRGDFGFEVFLWQCVGQLVVDLQVVELFAVSQEIEYEHLHLCSLPRDDQSLTGGRRFP